MRLEPRRAPRRAFDNYALKWKDPAQAMMRLAGSLRACLLPKKEEKVNKVRSKVTEISNRLGDIYFGFLFPTLSHQINILKTIKLPLAMAHTKTMSNLKTFHLYRSCT